MTPTIVLKDGKPYLALGSPGGPTIINSVLETMVNVIDFGMNVQDAVNWPRFHHQYLPDELARRSRLLARHHRYPRKERLYGAPPRAPQGESGRHPFPITAGSKALPIPRTEGTAAGR